MKHITKSVAVRISAIDAEIKLLQSMRAFASCAGELEMINDGIDAARAERRSIFRTR